MSVQKINLILEAKLGIDPTTTSLVGDDIGEHWLPDGVNILCLTKQPGTITGNYWNPSGNIISLDDTGSTSAYWTLQAGNTLQLNT